MKKFTRFLAIALFMIISLAACQTQTAVTTSPQTGPSTSLAETQGGTTTLATTQGGTTTMTTAAQAVASTAYPYEFTGANGNKVVIDKEPLRIVSLSPTYTEIVFALGVGDRLVGRTDYCDYPAEAAKVTSVGSMTEPSIEKIIELKPDVILISFMDQDVIKKIEQTGAKVIQMSSGDSIVESYKIMAEIAKIVNVNAAGDQMIETIKSDIAAISDKVKGLKPATAYYVAGFGQSGDYTAGDKTFMNDLITAAGGDNVAKDAQGWNYTAEKLLEKDPEYIVIGSMAQLADTFKKTEPYKNLTAVKEDRLKEIDDNLISREGPRLAEGVKLLAKILHPEAFK